MQQKKMFDIVQDFFSGNHLIFFCPLSLYGKKVGEVKCLTMVARPKGNHQPFTGLHTHMYL